MGRILSSRSSTVRPGSPIRPIRFVGLLAVHISASTIMTPAIAQPGERTPAATVTPATADLPVLFDGESLDGWRVIEKFDFDGHGEVLVKDGVIFLEKGKPATGISWKGKFPRSNYQLTLSGQRVSGNDFFCGLTFPVKDEYCSLILGGWGGSIVGLSNIDGFSAVENTTTQAIDFEQGRWYRIQLTVLDDRITITMDDKPLINVTTEGHKFSIWWEQEPVTPLGIVTWNTTGAIKDLELRRVAAAPAENATPPAENATPSAPSKP